MIQEVSDHKMWFIPRKGNEAMLWACGLPLYKLYAAKHAIDYSYFSGLDTTLQQGVMKFESNP